MVWVELEAEEGEDLSVGELGALSDEASSAVSAGHEDQAVEDADPGLGGDDLEFEGDAPRMEAAPQLDSERSLDWVWVSGFFPWWGPCGLVSPLDLQQEKSLSWLYPFSSLFTENFSYIC